MFLLSMVLSLALLQSTAAPDTQPTTQSVAQTSQQASEAAQQAAREARSAADLARKAAQQAQGQASPAPNPRTTPIRIFGITLVGMTRDNAIKLLMTVILIAVLIGLSWGLRALSKLAFSRTKSQKVIFWVRQAINLLADHFLHRDHFDLVQRDGESRHVHGPGNGGRGLCAAKADQRVCRVYCDPPRQDI